MSFKLTVNQSMNWIDVTDVDGNVLFGFTILNKQGEISSYEIVGARFNGAGFTKLPISWKRDKRGAVSRAFYDWFYEANKSMYQQFFKPVKVQ